MLYDWLQDFKHNLEYARNIIGTMQLEPKSRQQLQLLLQRQHLEEEELRLRHYMELEKFQKNLDSSEYFSISFIFYINIGTA